jgi:hypothetical protein
VLVRAGEGRGLPRRCSTVGGALGPRQLPRLTPAPSRRPGPSSGARRSAPSPRASSRPRLAAIRVPGRPRPRAPGVFYGVSTSSRVLPLPRFGLSRWSFSPLGARPGHSGTNSPPAHPRRRMRERAPRASRVPGRAMMRRSPTPADQLLHCGRFTCASREGFAGRRAVVLDAAVLLPLAAPGPTRTLVGPGARALETSCRRSGAALAGGWPSSSAAVRLREGTLGGPGAATSCQTSQPSIARLRLVTCARALEAARRARYDELDIHHPVPQPTCCALRTLWICSPSSRGTAGLAHDGTGYAPGPCPGMRTASPAGLRGCCRCEP